MPVHAANPTETERYHAKVSGRLQVIQVTELRGRSKTLIIAVNEATGREITIRSPVQISSKAD